MRQGSVIVDLAAERGGNTELTEIGETVTENGVTVMGVVNVASTVPYHASEMYSRNVTAFALHIISDGEAKIDPADEITGATLIARDGRITNERILKALGAE
jgi:NAD(P) transhydrogenase subunit alpha